MPKSKTAAGMDAIQSVVAAYLKTLGFRKSGRAFNREREDRMTQVVSFQMGQFPVGYYVIPGLRESLYGRFAVDLGVTLPCVRKDADKCEEKKFYQDYDCQIRECLVRDEEETAQSWWLIEQPYNRIGCEIAALLERKGIPFLDQFTSYRQALAYYCAHRYFPFQNEERSALEAALVYRHCEDTEQYLSLMRKAKDCARGHKGFVEFVSSIEAQFGKDG
ncbi:MAG: DUF4304 domain-containing protein [Opitutaceae bacterium]|nr:DUF4304 domain-containing protein [Opitutaceae bacterium]